jgi:hypothetical protein
MYIEQSQIWNRWDPRVYLAQYYQTRDVPQDEKAVCEFIHSCLAQRDVSFSRALDIGVGPTIHHDIALVPYAEHLDVADYLPHNLAEIRKWLTDDDDAHNWDVFLRGILTIEGITRPDRRAVEARRQLVKHRIGQLLTCDIRKPFPLGFEVGYPLVTAFYVADSVATSKSDWYCYMTNIASLVEPGGTLMISALRNAHYYRVGDHFFPSPMIDEEDVECLLLTQNFELASHDIQVAFTPELRPEGFESIVLASGTKPVS